MYPKPVLRGGRSAAAATFAIGLLVVAFGCGGDPLAARRRLDLEPALHGHWSCSRETVLDNGAAGWDSPGATEREIVEIDRYVDASTEDKAWGDPSGDFRWTTVAQDPATGSITVNLRPVADPQATEQRELRLDAGRTTLLERVKGTGGSVVVRCWNYINADSRP
jgi:hypothetical protein